MFKAASVQFKMIALDLEYNLKTSEKYIREAAKKGAQLILLPETSNLGSLCTTRNRCYCSSRFYICGMHSKEKVSRIY